MCIRDSFDLDTDLLRCLMLLLCTRHKTTTQLYQPHHRHSIHCEPETKRVVLFCTITSVFLDTFLHFLYNGNRTEYSKFTYLVSLIGWWRQNTDKLWLHLVTIWKDLEQHVIDSARPTLLLISDDVSQLTAHVSAKGEHFEHNLQNSLSWNWFLL